MLTFDSRDFAKSALSLSGGMLCVVFLAAWRSSGDIPTTSLTLGLPVGVLTFWAMYTWRMARLARELSFLRHQPPLYSHPNSTPKSPVGQALAKPYRWQKETITHTQRLPKFRSKAKIQPHEWETTRASQDLNQWFQ